MSQERPNNGGPEEVSNRPTAIHYALVISVCINVVAALGWYISEQNKRDWRARSQAISGEISALKDALADCRREAQEQKPDLRQR